MPRNADSLRATKAILKVLLPVKTCRCGHRKDYHLNGSTRCVFGICDCKSYNPPSLR